jgi:N-acetyltransferase 10
MVGNWPLFISSTVHGYEGTGRSLSLKLIKELRGNTQGSKITSTYRPMKEVIMEEPIRYKRDDPIEKWLYDLLCLNVRI